MFETDTPGLQRDKSDSALLVSEAYCSEEPFGNHHFQPVADKLSFHCVIRRAAGPTSKFPANDVGRDEFVSTRIAGSAGTSNVFRVSRCPSTWVSTVCTPRHQHPLAPPKIRSQCSQFVRATRCSLREQRQCGSLRSQKRFRLFLLISCVLHFTWPEFPHK